MGHVEKSKEPQNEGKVFRQQTNQGRVDINTASANQCENVNDIDGNFRKNCVVIVDSRVDV